MSKEKRSFFERITGSVSADETIVDAPINGKAGPASANWLEDEPEEGELSVDVYQTANEIVIQSMVAGVKPEDLQVTITRELVTIKGHRERPSVVDDESYFQKELYWGSFTRTILLPAEVEAEESEATERFGLLTLRLPKIDKAKIQKVKVRSV
ncbi:MAG: Hsp20/alpha crystallin family protein [Candidatus Vogelbacteria bacterium]|nr:Hsp20/alpha crystallin family protein [Candidatus Vogelbacteria bacterium]